MSDFNEFGKKILNFPDEDVLSRQHNDSRWHCFCYPQPLHTAQMMSSMHLTLQNSRDVHSCIGTELYHSCKTSSSRNRSPTSAKVWKRTQRNSLKSLKLPEGYVLAGQAGSRWLSNFVSGRMFHWAPKEWGWQTWKLPMNESYVRAETENQKWFSKSTFFKGGKFLKKLWCCVGGSITR